MGGLEVIKSILSEVEGEVNSGRGAGWGTPGGLPKKSTPKPKIHSVR
jgi:hypothetical protein